MKQQFRDVGLGACLTASCFASMAAANDRFIYPDVNAVAGAAAKEEAVI
jgi:hypothetical protein